MTSTTASPTVAGHPQTISAALSHACACGTTLTLSGARPLPDFDWWLEKLAEHERCAA